MDILKSLFTTVLGRFFSNPLIILGVLVVVGFIIYMKMKPKVESSKGSPELVLFYSESCGHCKTLMPHWERLESEYNGPIKLTKINVQEYQSVANDHNVNGVPDVRLYSNGLNSKEYTSYNGERSFDGLVSFLN